MEFPNDQFYFKSQAEMKELFSDYPAAIANTEWIAQRCDVEFDFDQTLLPHYDVPEGEDLESYLRKLVYQGAREKYEEITKEVEERIDYELKIINQMGYPAYFLIVMDFVGYAKDNDIIVGPGRGSAASSIVSYLLDITTIDPLEYDLLFERFLNPARVSMPDIDIDFCYERRDEVIDYVTREYGQERVAQIITFGTMAARAAVRDVGRVLDIDYDKTDKVAKAIPGGTITEALEESDDLAKMYQQDKEVEELLDYSVRLEGLPRHASTHAAGVVITEEELTEYTPLYQNGGEVTTQYPMGDLESLGLLKMDFLGLRNLTVIDKTLDLVEETKDLNLDLDEIPFDDRAVFELLSSGHSLGVFQLESDGIRRLMTKLKPEELEDVIALLALYRPGPLGSGMVDDYIARRHGEQEVEYPHPDLKEILEPTYGVILYQEQVMQIVQEIAGYSLGEADILRRIMGKKKAKLMEKHRQIFIEGNEEIPGAANNGYSRELGEELFELIEHFSGYGFNKAHSAAYAYVSYYTAYLKAHHPVEFMAALLSTQMGNSDKVADYINEARRMGITVLGPDVNHSRVQFTVEDGQIRFGLEAVKNVGQKAIEEIIASRVNEPFTDLRDFCQRVDVGQVNQRVVESLIKAGAFSSFSAHRSQLLEILPQLFSQVQSSQRKRGKGQTSFADLVDDEEEFGSEKIELPAIDEFSQQKLLGLEKEILGLYFSGHPLDNALEDIKNNRTVTIADLSTNQSDVIVGGIIVSSKEIITKNHREMAFLTIEDETDEIEVIVFPDVYSEAKEIISGDNVVLVEGRVDDEAKLIAAKVQDVHSMSGEKSKDKQLDSTVKQNKSEVIHLQVEEATPDKLKVLKRDLRNHSGARRVYLHLIIKDRRVSIKLAEDYNLAESSHLKKILDELGVKYSF
jgi:DNA polymerase-3 subunit alpha